MDRTLSKLQNRFQNRRITEGRLIIDQTLLQGGCLTLDQTLGDLLLISLLLGFKIYVITHLGTKSRGVSDFWTELYSKGGVRFWTKPFCSSSFRFLSQYFISSFFFSRGWGGIPFFRLTWVFSLLMTSS